MVIEITTYITRRGKNPFSAWLKTIKDKTVKARVIVRINRLENNNFGDCKSINNKIKELRLHFGSGYRVYFVMIDNKHALILTGGTKRTQKRDICLAKSYWQDYLERCDEKSKEN